MHKYIHPQEKLLHHLPELAAWKTGQPFAPISIEMDLTNRCNLGCAHCDFSALHTRGPLATSRHPDFIMDAGDQMTLDLAAKIFKDLQASGVKTLTFTGGGEPTLHPQFIEAAQLALLANLQLGMYSNGSLLNERSMELIKTRFQWVVISLDEPTANQYRALKQSDAFGIVIDKIRRLTHLPGPCVVGLSFLMHRENYGQWAEMMALHEELGTDYVLFRPSVKFKLESPAEIAEDPSWVDEIMPTLEILSHRQDVEVNLNTFRYYRQWSRPYSVCSAILFTGVITPDGSLWKCVNRRGYDDSFLGNLRNEEFSVIWERQKPHTDFSKCRLLCRGDPLNRTLDSLTTPVTHQDFL